ncbi:hypothetical protein ACQEUU_28150 [Nonomuraea sp. CA-218870]|uniref:hypothetical protein n=1 Tax=Nonomuraea sp. CA-218870 TaxID=3239998 RepID=UPI003D8D659E
MTRPPAHHPPGPDPGPGDRPASATGRLPDGSVTDATRAWWLTPEPRATFTEERGQADRELVRLGLQDVPAPWGDPHGQE